MLATRTILSILILTAGTVFGSSAFARDQVVVTTKAYTLKSEKSGNTIMSLSKGQELIAETCSQTYCRIRIKINGTTRRFLLKRLELRQRITSKNRLSMRNRGALTGALDPAVDTSRSERRTGDLSFEAPTCSCAYGSCRISSGFGPRNTGIKGASTYHQGLDIAGGAGTPIVAAESGTITIASFLRGYGNTIDIDHGKGYKTRYAHMSRFARRSGWVQRGEVIGYMGSTGRVSGPHLHFEVWKSGSRINPKGVIGVTKNDISRSCAEVKRLNRGRVGNNSAGEVN